MKSDYTHKQEVKRKKLAFIISIVILIGLLPAIACKTDEGNTRTSIQVKDIGTLWAEQEAADDIMTVPGGSPAYRANVQQQGVENPWTPIEVSEVTLSNASEEAYIYYRTIIETAAGKNRNNVIKVIIPNKGVDSLSLYAIGVPAGITLINGMQWGGPGARASVVVIEIARDVAPGQYTFEIGIEIKGEDYGTVPCTIKVIHSI
jgi:hypothetical protein